MRLSIIVILLVVIGCGVYSQKLTIEDQEYRNKTYDLPCGELNLRAQQVRGDFLVYMSFNARDSVFIYGDSLNTTFNGKTIDHSFQRNDTLYGSQERGFFIDVLPEYWSRSKTDSILIDLDGMIYCQKKKIDFENIYIIIDH